MNEMQHRICRTQAMLFEWAADNKYSFPEFADIYLSSDFCARNMDTVYSTFQLREPLEHMDFIRMECPNIDNLISDRNYSGAIAYFAGYIYRALYYNTGLPSYNLIRKYPYNEKIPLWYPGLHTVDYDMATDMILGRK